LGSSGAGFDSIDAKLNAAVSEIAKGELGRKLTHETEKLGKAGRMMKGRQALSIIYEHFRTSEEAGALHDSDDLMNVNMNGDKLEAFIQTWDQVLIGMREDPDLIIQKSPVLETNSQGIPISNTTLRNTTGSR
jgi:hypothetical protein